MIAWIISSSLMIVVIIGLRLLFHGKVSRRLQYALWGLVLLRLLMPFSLFETPFSVMHVIPESSISLRQVYVLPISEQPVTEASGIFINNTGALVNTNSFGYAVLSEDGTTVTRYAERMNVGQILVIIWVMGSIAIALWFACTNVKFYLQLCKTRQTYPIADFTLPVYISEDIASPCLFGLIHTAVYLTPKAVQNEDNTCYALAHELSHYRHGDHIWAIMRCLCLAVWWWNPLVWAAAFLSRQDSELACDEAVIKQIGRENRFAYGHTLVDMVAGRKAPTGLMFSTTTMTSGKRGLQARLNMIIKNPGTVIPALAAVLLIVAVSAGCTFTGAIKNAPNTQGQPLPAVNDQAQTPTPGSVSYALIQLKNGQYLSVISPLSGDNAKLAEDTIMNYMIKSAAWRGVDIKVLEECYLLRAAYADGTTAHYYAYLLDGNAVMQHGENGQYSRINNELYERIVKLAHDISTINSLNSPVTTSSSSKPGNVTKVYNSKNLNASIANAILSANADGHNGDLAAEAHTVLKSVESGNTTTVYVMALYLGFGYAGSGFFETGGNHMPVAITFEKNAAEEYELKEYWRPKDGSYYGPSIKEKFPDDIGQDALDTQKYIASHIQACYEQAIQYGQVNTSVEVAKLIETITSSPSLMSNPQTYIEAHQAEYRKLIYYGNHTLRYCFALFEKGGQAGLDGHIMASACRDILGNTREVNLPANTGQEWYDAYIRFAKNRT